MCDSQSGICRVRLGGCIDHVRFAQVDVSIPVEGMAVLEPDVVEGLRTMAGEADGA